MSVDGEWSDENELATPAIRSRPSLQRAASASSPKDRSSERRSLLRGSPGARQLFHGSTPSRTAAVPEPSLSKGTRSSAHSSSFRDDARQAPFPHAKPPAPSTRSSSHLSTPSSSVTKVHQTPKNLTPQRGDLSVDKVVESLRSFANDVRRDHARLVNFTLESQRPRAQRHLSSHDDLGGLSLTPVDPPVQGEDTMKVRLKVCCSVMSYNQHLHTTMQPSAHRMAMI